MPGPFASVPGAVATNIATQFVGRLLGLGGDEKVTYQPPSFQDSKGRKRMLTLEDLSALGFGGAPSNSAALMDDPILRAFLYGRG